MSKFIRSQECLKTVVQPILHKFSPSNNSDNHANDVTLKELFKPNVSPRRSSELDWNSNTGIYIDKRVPHRLCCHGVHVARKFHSEITVPRISKFRIVEPSDLPQQRKGSNDCGIWVAQWMKECGWTDDFGITVSDSDRMMLAIDLVSKEFNMKKSEVMDKAHAYMKNILQK
ncbi:hypothetical protein HN51_021703 [Arachis hypogaea]